MQVISLTQARNSLSDVFNSAYYDKEEVIIHRKGKENVVVISLDEYNSIKETQYLLSSANNRARLASSLAKTRTGRTFGQDIIE